MVGWQINIASILLTDSELYILDCNKGSSELNGKVIENLIKFKDFFSGLH